MFFVVVQARTGNSRADSTDNRIGFPVTTILLTSGILVTAEERTKGRTIWKWKTCKYWLMLLGKKPEEFLSHRVELVSTITNPAIVSSITATTETR